MFDAIGIGRNCVDFLAVLDGLPVENSKARVREHLVEGGGQSSTATVALARLGLKTAFAGLVGDDEEGQFSLRSLAREGVDTSLVRIIPEAATPVAQIWVNRRSGTRTIAYLDSMRGRLAPELFSRESLLDSGCILVDPFGAELALSLVPEARRRGIPVVYDAEHYGDGLDEMLSAADYVVASEEVMPVLGAASPEEALEKIFARGGKQAVVITRGERGSLGLSGRVFHHEPAVAVNVVDTTAAGDAYHAGFAYGVIRGWDLSGCMRMGAVLGALVCRDLGGRRSLPDLAEAMRVMGEENI